MTPEQMRKRIAIREAVAAREAASAAPQERIIGSPKEALGAVAEGLGQTAVGSTLLGAGRSVANLAHGGRQAFNKLTGDEEELARLGDEEAQRRERFAKLTALHPTATTVGEVAGAVIPAIAATPLTGGGSAVAAASSAARTVPALARMGLSTAGKVAGSSAAGAVGGSIAPLTAEEEEAGMRKRNAALGAVIGGVVPAATGGGRFVKETVRRTGRMTPEEGVEDIVQRLGYRGEGSAASAELRQAVTGRKKQLSDEFNQRYAAAEQMPGMPPVSLSGANQALASISNLSGEISKSTSPALHKVISSVKRATDPTQTQIVNAQGQPFSLPKEFTFQEVREAQRELKALARRLERSKDRGTDAARVRAAIDELDIDLAQWEARVGGAPAAGAKAVDAAYREQVAPFGKDQLARYLRSETATPNLLMGSREVVEDTTRRVPGARAPMRTLLGEKGAARPRELISGQAEVLMSPEEAAYARQVVGALRREQSGSIKDAMVRALPGQWAERGLYGVEDFGYNAPGTPKYLRNLMYSMGLGNVAVEDE